VADAELGPELADGLIMAYSGLLERSRAVEDFLTFGCCYSIHLASILADADLAPTMLFAPAAIQANGLGAADRARFPQLPMGQRSLAFMLDHAHLAARDHLGYLARLIVTGQAADAQAGVGEVVRRFLHCWFPSFLAGDSVDIFVCRDFALLVLFHQVAHQSLLSSLVV